MLDCLYEDSCSHDMTESVTCMLLGEGMEEKQTMGGEANWFAKSSFDSKIGFFPHLEETFLRVMKLLISSLEFDQHRCSFRTFLVLEGLSYSHK